MMLEVREKTPSAPPAHAPDRLTLAHELASYGFPERAYAIALEMFDFARCSGDEQIIAESAECLAYCCLLIARFEQGVHFARLACASREARGEASMKARNQATLAMLLAYIGEPNALIEATAALTWAEHHGGPENLVWALQANCLALLLLKQPALGIVHGERAVRLGHEAGRPCAWAYLGLAEAVIWTELQSGIDDSVDPSACPDGKARSLRAAVEKAVGLSEEALNISRRTGDGWFERAMINNIAEYRLYTGDADRAEACLRAFDGAAGEATDRSRAHRLVLQARIAAVRKLHEDALVLLTRARDMAGVDDIEFASMCQRDLAEVHARLGAFEPAFHAHRAYHDLYVRRASQEAERRARLCALQSEAQELRAATADARAKLRELSASNEFLSREAERLLRTSLEDPLTGLPNRRSLDVAFLEMMDASVPFALAVIDVDRFKQVNDCFSHPVGDAVLRGVADLLRANSGSENLIVRYGGEEFVLLTRDANAEAVERLCEALRSSVQAHPWHSLRPSLVVTVSIGAATSCEVQSTEKVMALADQRLYQAKQEGRNRVVTW